MHRPPTRWLKSFSERLLTDMNSTATIERTQGGHLALAFGTQSEREEYMPVLAESLGINERDANQTHVMGTLLKAQGWMRDFAAVPGLHMEAVPFKNKRENRTDYSLIMKYNWSLHNLSEYNREHNGINYILTEKPATPDEVREQYDMLGEGYIFDPRDVGMWGGLVDTRMAPELVTAMAASGISIVTWHFGCYRHQVLYGDYVKEETLPATDTKERVALRRSHKKAINHTIPPYPIVNAWNTDDRHAYALSEMMGAYQDKNRTEDPRSRAPIAESSLTADDDDFLWATSRTVTRPAKSESKPVEQAIQIDAVSHIQPISNVIEDGEDVDFYEDDGAAGDTPKVSELAEAGLESWMKALRHVDNRQPIRQVATIQHYRLMLKQMGQWLPKTGAQPQAIMSYLLGRPVNENDRPAKSVVTKVLKLVQKEVNFRLDGGGWSTQYIDNPDYDEAVINWIRTLNRDLKA